MRLFIISFLLTLTHGKTVKYIFNISYISGSPDGVFKQTTLGINGKFPGPVVTAEVGDILEIKVINSIQTGENTSIHWHGIHQRGTPFHDGASMVTQYPIGNGEEYVYQFEVDQAGTYWYHSHFRSQYTDGLWGVLIVRNKAEKYSYDDEFILTLNDWYHRNYSENEAWYLSKASEGEPPVPDSVLLNGFGRYPCNYAKKQGLNCDRKLQRRKVFSVKRGKNYRIRIINTSAVFAFWFQIEGHQLTVIEVDGVEVEKERCDVIEIAPAQRVSILLESNLTRTGKYLMRADVPSDLLKFGDGSNINAFYKEAFLRELTAVLHYKDVETENSSNIEVTLERHTYLDKVPEIDDKLLERRSKFLPDLDLRSSSSSPRKVDKKFTLTTGFYEEEGTGIRKANFNYTFFKLPKDKPLLEYVRKNETLPGNVMPLEVRYMDVVQVVINNPFFGAHPFHLHGFHFFIMGAGGWRDGNYDPNIHKLRNVSYVMRDTFMVNEKSWAVIRFVADNAGVWLFHCHNEWHMLSGMVATFVVGRNELIGIGNLVYDKEKVPDNFGNFEGNDVTFFTYFKEKDLYLFSLTISILVFIVCYNYSKCGKRKGF